MKFIGETSITTLLTLIKTEIAKYFPKPTNAGTTGQVLKKTTSGSQWSNLTSATAGLLKGDGNGGITEATEGTDYLKTAPVTSVNGKTGEVQLAIPSATPAFNDTPSAPTAAGDAGTSTSYARGDHKHPKEVFYATFETTTFAEILAASEAGKLVVCIYGSASTGVPCYLTRITNGDTAKKAVFVSLFELNETYATSPYHPYGMGTFRLEATESSGQTTWKVGLPYLASIDDALGHMKKITLSSTGWDSSTKQQTVSVTYVRADPLSQKITIAPVDTSYESVWNTCGVMCVSQGNSSLTFQCETIPTTNIEAYVDIRYMNYS